LKLKWKPQSATKYEPIPAEHDAFARAKRAAYIRDVVVFAVVMGVVFFLLYPLLPVQLELQSLDFALSILRTQVIFFVVTMLISFRAG